MEKIYRDEDEWSSWNGRGDPVLHIELRKWADVLVIAPLRSQLFTSLMALDLPSRHKQSFFNLADALS